VNELLELIRLPGLGARFPDQLSGGQQQRVAIARAMAFTPRVLLMDEPFGALDVKLRETMQVEIVRIQRALGVTTIFVTHDQDEAMRLADRILIMRDGLVEQLGTPEQLYACPATPFVAGFLGKVNLLAGTIIGQVGEAVRLKLATGETVLAQGAPEMPRSSAIILAIRPENLHFHCDLQGQQNRISGVIESRRFLGSWIAYSVSTRHGTTLQVMRPAGEKQWNVGEPVELVFDLRNATVFPSAHSP
jgi:ABC-type Fe3+/spermidine/putrescine transport system ATPase subunit